MATLNEQLAELQTARDNIKTALEGKGQAVTKDIRTYADAINNIVSEGGTSTNASIKLFATKAAMNADTTAEEGDLAIVYGQVLQNWDGSSAVQTFTFPQTVVLPYAMTGSCNGYYNGSVFLNMNGSVSNSAASFDISGTSEYAVRYTSQDGLTYTRTSSDETITIASRTISIDMSSFSDVCGYFMQVGGMTFEGIFKYKTNYVEQYICNFIDTFTYSNEAVTNVSVKPIDVTKLCEVLENASITMIARPTVLINRQDDNDVYIVSNDGMNVAYLYDINNNQ